MIGTRTVLAAAVVAVGLALVVGAGGSGPTAALEARRLVADRAAAADDALAALESAMQPSVDAARRGAAGVVTGEEPPGADLDEASERLEDAQQAASAATAALAALDGAVRAAGLDASVPEPVTPDELASIGSQLAGAGPAADAFAAMRQRAEGLVGLLDDALAALDQGSLTAGRQRVAEARADHDVIEAWEVELVTLPVWLETTDAMIGAMEAIMAAAEAGDEAAALAAAEEFTARAEDAATADRALRIAIGEGGTAVTAAPVSRLAAALRDIADARVAVVSIGATAER
jgi:hypothetical protein